MSATQVPLRPIKKGSLTRLWLAIAFLVAAGIGIAMLGTAPLQGETTESGVFVRTVQAGTGNPITANDGAFVIYEGSLADGTQFDSSNGQPVPMLPSRLIPGFSEALQTMSEGGKYEIRIPAALAYGSEPPPGSPIPPDADLFFDVEIAQVVRDAAIMAQQQQQQLPPPPVDGDVGADLPPPPTE